MQTRLIVLDEAQQIAQGTIPHREAFLSSLQQVALRSGAIVVLVGTEAALKLVSASWRLAVLSLPAWPLGEEFHSLAAALEIHLSPDRPLGVTAHLAKLHAQCEGHLGELVTLLTTAARDCAQLSGTRSLTNLLNVWVPPSQRFEGGYELL